MPHGLLVLDKPAGVSSARALAPLKQLVGKRTRVGHAGTLDPFATGVLLALVGDATRLSELAMALPKRYRATVRFGRGTDTLDPEGETTEQADPGSAPPREPAEVLSGFVGEIEQLPPAFSALKVEGQRAYRRARRGEEVRLEPRRVTVHAIEVSSLDWPDLVLDIRSGSGFYVRSLARDLGRALGLPAHLAALRRIAIGPFRADDGQAPEHPDPAALLAPRRIVEAAGLPFLEVPPEQARAFASGSDLKSDGDAIRIAVTCGPLLVGLGVREGVRLRPKTILSAARRSLEEPLV